MTHSMEKSRAVKEMFDDIAGTYDLLNHVLSFNIDKRWRRRAVARLPHGSGTRVLDLASGTLDLALAYMQGGGGLVSCVDFSLEMLLHGLNKVPPTLDKRMQLVCADGLSLPFPDHTFDAAMCAYGMRNLTNNRRGLKELHRVLKPNASLLILDFFRPATATAKFFSATYNKFILPTIGGLISKNKTAYHYLYESVCNFYSLQEYQVMMEEFGFQIVQAKNLGGGISSMIYAESLH